MIAPLRWSIPIKTKRKTKAVDYERLFRRQVTDDARDLVDSLREAVDFNDINTAVIEFICLMDNKMALNDQDLINLTAQAVINRNESPLDAMNDFREALDHALAKAVDQL